MSDKHIAIRNINQVLQALLTPEADKVKDAWIDRKVNAEAKLEFLLPLTSEKWPTINAECRMIVDGREFVLLKPDAIDVIREEEKVWGKVMAQESWMLLGKSYPEAGISNDPDVEGPVELEFTVLSGGDPFLGCDPGTAKNAVSYLLDGTDWSVGTVDVTGIHDIEVEKISRLAIIQKIQEIWGGILVWAYTLDVKGVVTNRTFHLRDESWGNYTGFQVRYGKNLKGITRTEDLDLVTKLYVFGENDLDIASVNAGNKFVANYTYTPNVYVGVFQDQGIHDANDLKEKGQKLVDKLSYPRYSYRINLLDVTALPEWVHESYALADVADVYDEEVGADIRARIVRHRYDVFQPWKCQLDIGEPEENLAAQLKNAFEATKYVQQSIAPNPGTINLLKGVLDTYHTIIQGASGQFETNNGVSTWWDVDEYGDRTGKLIRVTPQGLLISENSGVDSVLAMTGAGIAANAITTGLLSAARVEIGSGSTFGAGYDPSVKRRVFTVEPTTPYDVGDLWSGGVSGELRVCATAQGVGGSYNIAHWPLATKYTDDTAAKTHADNILKSMADGTYTGGTFIDGKSIISPIIAGTLGRFTANIKVGGIGNNLAGISGEGTDGDSIRFWAGHETPGSAPFQVTQAGILKAVGALIDGAVMVESSAEDTFYFVDSVDPTKRMQFNLSNISTGTLRVLTVPNDSGTIALTHQLLQLGETSATAYRGDRGKIAYDHSQDVTGAVHGAVSVATVNMIVRRDSAGRARVAAPSHVDDIARLAEINTKENTITAGTTAQYWRGDKTWQTLLGTTATTAYRGDHGLSAYNHSQISHTIDYILQIGGTSARSMTIGRYLQHATGVPTSNLGSPTVTEMALFDSQFDNKLWFYPHGQFTFEYTNNGTDWIAAGVTDAQIKNLVSGYVDSSVPIPHGCLQYRIRIRNRNVYVYLNCLYVYWSSQGNNTSVKINKKHDSSSWEAHTTSDTTVAAWPGHLYLPFNTIPWLIGGTLGTHYNDVEILFTPTWNHASNNIMLYRLEMWGGYPAGNRSLFSWDSDRNATFPAALRATRLGVGVAANGTYLLNLGGALVHGTATGVGIGTLTPAETLHVAGNARIEGYASSPTFVSGFAGSGWRVDTDNRLTVDYLTVRKIMDVYELVINQIRATNGSIWVSDACKIATVSGSNPYTCTIDVGTGTNNYVPFVDGDVVRCQRWNKQNSSVKYYTATVSSRTNTGFVLTRTDGASAVEVGDEVVRIGSSVSGRQGAIYLTSSDNNAPYIDVLDGVTSHDLTGKTKVRLGKLDGITDAVMGALSGYGLYSENAYLRGKIVADTGYIGGATNGWEIAAGLITAIGSGKLRTSSTTTRMEMDSTGLKGYNAGTQRVQILSDGSGWLGASDKIAWTNAGVLSVSGWTIDSTSLLGTNARLRSSGILSLGSADAWATANSIYIDGPNSRMSIGSGFQYTGGSLTISGSATIGGWTITTSSIQTGAFNTSGTRYFGSSGLSLSNTFSVTSAGALTSISGSIGGWTIDSAGIKAGATNATAKGMLSGDTIAFYAGHLTPGSAPFRVTQAGALFATGATISGSITGSTITGSTIQTATSGARAELGGGGSPYFRMYDATRLRVEMLEDRIKFYNTAGTDVGGLYGLYIDPINYLYLNSTAVLYLAGATGIKATAGTGTILLESNVTVAGSKEFYASGIVHTASTIQAGGNTFPGATNSYDLGTTALRWRDLYLTGNVDMNGILFFRVSAADSAHQRADARDDATNFSRLHWWGVSDAGTSSNFRHAWYDGATYINVTAASGVVTFGGTINANSLQVGANTVIDANRYFWATQIYVDGTRGVPTADIRDLNVTQAKIATDAVGWGELKKADRSQSASLAGSTAAGVVNGGLLNCEISNSLPHFPSFYSSENGFCVYVGNINATAYYPVRFGIRNSSINTRTAEYRSRYHND